MARQTPGGRVGRTIYMTRESWDALGQLSVPEAARAGDSAKLEAMVQLVPRLREELAAAVWEVNRLRSDLQRVRDLGGQLLIAEQQVRSAMETVLDRLGPVQAMVWETLREKPGDCITEGRELRPGAGSAVTQADAR